MNENYENFRNDLLLEAEVSGVLQAEAFFQLYASAAIENGDIEHVEHCPVRFEGARKFRIDGYSFNRDQGELILVICDYRTENELKSLNASDVESLFLQVERFLERSKDATFINNLEDSSPTFEAAYFVHSSLSAIRRVRIMLFSNARMSVRKKLVTMREENGVRFSYSILDFERYNAIQNSRTGSDPIEIDFMENGLSPLSCLLASSTTDKYASYLVVIPGRVLAEIYGLYGARLLEANVRTFLQARTKVNKGIIRTLKDNPENFFAFNNGLTATASGLSLTTTDDGTFIKSMNNLQIVNGGQTTASILYARDREKADLSNVYVQMKLAVVKPELMEEIVPQISRFANTQNKVSEADFFSSHPFHLHMEKISRRVTAPPKEGALAATNWFYERARGQYKDEQAYMSPSARKRFLAKYPRDQMVVKTDLAKYEMSFDCKPHVVSKGAQKCFMAFADKVDKKWTPEAYEFGDGYFQDSMARALIFRWADKMIGTSDWYKNDRGYKSQTVTYTIATIVNCLREETATLNYRTIWTQQEVPPSLRTVLEDYAPKVAALIKDPPENVRNIGEYCKTQACWARVSAAFDVEISRQMPDVALAVDQEKERKKDDRTVRIIDHGIDAQMRVVELAGRWEEIRDYGKKKRILSHVEISILNIATQIPKRLPSEKQSAVALGALDKVLEDGFKL